MNKSIPIVIFKMEGCDNFDKHENFRERKDGLVYGYPRVAMPINPASISTINLEDIGGSICVNKRYLDGAIIVWVTEECMSGEWMVVGFYWDAKIYRFGITASEGAYVEVDKENVFHYDSMKSLEKDTYKLIISDLGFKQVDSSIIYLKDNAICADKVIAFMKEKSDKFKRFLDKSDMD